MTNITVQYDVCANTLEFLGFLFLPNMLAVYARIHQPLQRLGSASEALHRAHESDAERGHTARHAAHCDAFPSWRLR